MAAPIVFFVVFGLAMMGDGPFVTSVPTTSAMLYKSERNRRTRKASQHYRQQAIFEKYHEGISMYYD